MRVFVAGASGVIGRRLLPLLREAGHEVAGMTRSPARADLVRSLGAEPVVADAFDAEGLARALAAWTTIPLPSASGCRSMRPSWGPLDPGTSHGFSRACSPGAPPWPS